MGVFIQSLSQRRSNRERFRIKSCNKGRLRLSVFRSNRQIYAQIIDDVAGRTLAAASSLEKELKEKTSAGTSKEKAAEVGKLIAMRAKKIGTEKVVFDRGRYGYHGLLSSLADAARKGGLKF